MAEGFASKYLSDQINAYSAGIQTHGMNLNAVEVMGELGIDLGNQSSKLCDSLANVEFDLVITVCGHADENCPAALRDRKIQHVGFDDPPKLAKDAKTREEMLSHYRRVRDEIGEFVRNRLPRMLD